jgi:hypothetical protein
MSFKETYLSRAKGLNHAKSFLLSGGLSETQSDDEKIEREKIESMNEAKEEK